jgi:hypothetical protein
MSGSAMVPPPIGRGQHANQVTPGQADRPPGLREVPGLLARFAPYYLRHVILQPYRGLGAVENIRDLLSRPVRRHQIAVYDAVLDLMLKGYAELAGHPLRPRSGQVAVMLTRVGFAFDDEYERRKSRQENAGFKDLLASRHVQEYVLEWRAFMQDYGEYDSIRNFLMDFVARLYRRYAETVEAPGDQVGFDAMMDGAALDSGGLLVALARVLALFHNDASAEALLTQFSSVGVNGKLADDVIDFQLDVVGGRPNLLLALARGHEDEYAEAMSLAGTGKTLGTRWWQRNCPLTYQQLVAAYQEQQAQITSRWLRYVSRLMWAPALLGHARKKETRGRI